MYLDRLGIKLRLIVEIVSALIRFASQTSSSIRLSNQTTSSFPLANYLLREKGHTEEKRNSTTSKCRSQAFKSFAYLDLNLQLQLNGIASIQRVLCKQSRNNRNRSRSRRYTEQIARVAHLQNSLFISFGYLYS